MNEQLNKDISRINCFYTPYFVVNHILLLHKYIQFGT